MFASAINDRSDILVRYFDAPRSEWRGAILRGTQITAIDTAPGEQILAVGDMNNRRQALIDEVPSGAFGLAGVDINDRMAVLTALAFPLGESGLVRIWFEGTITDYERLPGSSYAEPLDFSNRGTVVGISSYPESDPEPNAAVATIWRRGVPSDRNALTSHYALTPVR